MGINIKKYDRYDLNNYDLNLVCEINSYFEHCLISQFCPNIHSYDKEYRYYLTSRSGYSKFKYDYELSRDRYDREYKIITINEIDIIECNLKEFSNGVPIIWDI